MRKLTKKNKRRTKAVLRKKDQDIDFSDIPAVLDWSGAEIGKFYRPPETPVAKTPKQPKFALCVRSDDSEELERRKVYQVLPDRAAAREGYVRIVDESGEDYLYPSDYFVPLKLPAAAQRELLSSGQHVRRSLVHGRMRKKLRTAHR